MINPGLISFCVLLLFGMQASLVQAEIISTFDASYTVNSNGEVTVQETIVYDFQGEERHGIFRTIKNTHPQPASVLYKKRYIDIDVQSVTRDGQDEPFELTNDFGSTEIKIGNANETISGVATYVLSYVLYGALSYGSSGVEFYYNVTGNDWAVPISLASASVNSNNFGTKYACYQGAYGNTTSCTNTIKNDSRITFTANALEPGEGLTIATELDAAAIKVVANEQVTWILFGAIMAVL